MELLDGEVSRSIFGSSVDTYWTIQDPDVNADFIRMRERDGIRQITVKGKDRGSNLNRMEIDIDSTSSVELIERLLIAAHGKPAGTVGKTYYVYWLEGESQHTTVCCYSVLHRGSVDPNTVIEVETTSEAKMLEMEAKVIREFRRRDLSIERAPGSLFEMYIQH